MPIDPNWINYTFSKHDKKRLDRKEIFSSYWHQINEIVKINPKSVLEVGIGNGFVSNYLQRLGLNIVSLDLVRAFEPQVNSSVLDMPFSDNCFDACLCCEVLEHLPFNDFEVALKEFYRVSRKTVVLSLPDVSLYFGIKTINPLHKIPLIYHTFPNPFAKEHVFDGQHYWEIGKKGYQVRKILSIIENSGFKLEQSFRVFEVPYHRFFILSKK